MRFNNNSINPKVLVIILSRTGKEIAKGIDKQDYDNYELLKIKSDISIYKNRNLGIKLSKNMIGENDFILWLDDDAIVPRNLISILVKEYQEKEKMLNDCGLKLGGIQANRIGLTSRRGWVDYLCEYCWLIKANVMWKHSFEENFDIFWGDVDLSYTLLKEGYLLYVTHEVQCKHGRNTPRGYRGYIHLRNSVMMARKWYSSWKKFRLYFSFIFLFPILWRRHRCNVWKAFIDGFFRNFKGG